MLKVKTSATITTSDANINIAIDKAFARWGVIVLNEAKNKHRYISRTGNLRNATSADYLDNKLRLYINDAKANYGKYVHDGVNGRTDDQFIDSAVANNITLLDEFIIQEINKLWLSTTTLQQLT